MSLHEDLKELRGQDSYPNEEIKNQFLRTFFPKDINELVSDLSNVTAAFYGFLLQQKEKTEDINQSSEKLFYELGTLKTLQAIAKMPLFPKDCRSFIIVIISAIYNASPEYIFNIIVYEPDFCQIQITGIDRYHRILKNLSLDAKVNFPTLIPFMYAIKTQLNLTDIEINVACKEFSNSSETNCIYTFKKII
jgi:hypothetical protein